MGRLIMRLSSPDRQNADITNRIIQGPSNSAKEARAMLNLEVKTDLSLEEVVNKLKAFFSKGGLGLALKEEEPLCLSFEGGGGFVSARLCEEQGKTHVDLTTREWEHQVKQFASEID